MCEPNEQHSRDVTIIALLVSLYFANPGLGAWKSSLPRCKMMFAKLLRQQREELMTLHRTVAATTRAAGLSLAFALGAAVTAEAQMTDPRVADLVRAGKVRVGLFLPQYGKGPDGLRTTVWVETARAYAARVGIPLVIVEHATPPEAITCLKTGACDQLFLPLDARAAEIGEFSNPIFQFDYTLMVAADSSIAKVADADRPGVRIAAVRNHASANELVRQVKQAEFVYAETPEQTFALVRLDPPRSARLLGEARRRARACGSLRRKHQPHGRAQRQGGLARLRQRVRRGRQSLRRRPTVHRPRRHPRGHGGAAWQFELSAQKGPAAKCV
jgi:hypothetical protein